MTRARRLRSRVVVVALDEDALIEEHESDRESENALLALAIYYARYGKGPFKMSALSNVAKERNLDIPNRADMFFKGHKRDGKEIVRTLANRLASGQKPGVGHQRQTDECASWTQPQVGADFDKRRL